MPALRLILDPEGAAFYIDDAMLIGACASQIAAQFGYPLSDSAGTPAIYQLRPTLSGSLFPNDQRFRDLQLVSGTRLTLESSIAGAPERSIHTGGHPAVPQFIPRPRRRWSRRAVLATGVIATFALTGFGTGLTVALAQRYLGSRNASATPLV